MNKPQKHSDATTWEASPNDLEAFWMPFTANRAFKKKPRMIAGAKDMHYYDSDGPRHSRRLGRPVVLNAGHCRQPIVEAIQKQAAELDFSPTFQFGHPKAFQLASTRRSARARRSRSCLLRQLRLGGGRHRAEDRARLSQRARARRAARV